MISEPLLTRNSLSTSDLEPVVIQFRYSMAAAVAVVGTFNQWNPQTTPMFTEGGGLWTVHLSLPPGRYEYRLMVDGRSMPDPEAIASVGNAEGGSNSILKVTAGGSPGPQVRSSRGYRS